MSNNRQSYKCPIFGTIEDLKENVLPTYQDVMKYYEWSRVQVKINNGNNKEPTFSEIAEIVTKKVEGVWQKASIPVVSHTRVIQLLKAYHSKCKNIIKSLKRLSTEKKTEFLKKSEILFDICSCKCKILSQCNCPRSVKVPKEEHDFLIDQRGERKMRIGGIDRNRTKSLQKKFVRKQASTKIYLKSDNNQSIMPEKELMLSTSSDSDTNVSYPEKLHKYIEEPLPSTSGTMENKICVKSLPVLSQICDRYGVSDRAGAAIASAVLHELSSDIVIDKSKLRRERRKTRDALVKTQAPLNLPALYFDGRKDKTLTIVTKGTKRYKQVVIEEHVSVIKEPDSIYVGYVTPSQGTAKTIEISINALLFSKSISTDDLLAIGCDGTVINTGKFSGVIRLFEKRLQRPLQWIVCMLHLNELPLRHLFDYMDGKTSGPSTYNGPIGKLLDKSETRAVVEFESIPGQLPTLKPENLSTDQKYLYEITLAVVTGSCSDDLVNKSPGKMSHARWLTKANRILRLYISSPKPSTNLIILAQYIVKVYAPVWFQIKTHSSCKDGSRHLWKLIESSRFLSCALKSIIDPVIQRNAYFAHPENLLLAMLTDEEKHIRELAARRILKARNSPSMGKLPRTFEVPKLNFDAKCYIDLINWQETNFDPPILRNQTNDELIQIIDKNGDERMLFIRLPCHTQAVERSVKIVTEAAMSACDKKTRDGMIHAKLASRKVMPKFDSKRDFLYKNK
ncbi:unnamed protein product [Diatraea saccharalis]|uniref:Uncharacterized protein n=1 Tax=Diatraea saccharalis TaxID=40085 RepID=A0A9N9WFS5_9NEOP|nr:unnamed protein product [Diatraea saccharalis]